MTDTEELRRDFALNHGTAMVSTEELRNAETRYRRADRAAEKARETRNWLIREALKEGWTHARIAQATGLTRGRIGQLAMQNGHCYGDESKQ